MIKDILFSLFKTVVVAAGLGAFTSYLTQYDMLKCCMVFFIGQYIIFYFWNSYLQNKYLSTVEQQETERIKVFSQQGIEVNCAHCNQPNFVPVRMDEENEFTCEQCGKHNSIYVDITVAQKAQLIDRDRLSITSYIKDKIDAEQKLR